MCHAPESDFPMANYLRGQDANAFYAAIGRLAELNELMPPFEGTDAERRALAEYLAGLGQPAGAR
jgi:mono/diheme cytochrome c family protein